MKYFFNLLLIFAMTIAICGCKNNIENNLPLLGKVIVVDAGHGGKDPGTVVDGVTEKSINLQISNYLSNYLEHYGAIVYQTRTGDYDLASPESIKRKKSDFDNRIYIINSNNINFYLSIHLNYYKDTSYDGPQVFYGDKKLAQSIKKSLNSKRDIKPIPEYAYMYKKLKTKGVLIECGFLSNEVERVKLNSTIYQQKIAKKIASGVVNYYNQF